MAKEDSFLKKDVLQLQKKVADLELILTELKEEISKYDPALVEELKQKVEDVEDLTLVENAGMIELKKIMEELSSKIQQPQQVISPQLEERLNSLEEKVSTIQIPNVEEIKNSIIASLPSIGTGELEGKITEVKNYFEKIQSELESKINSFEDRLSQIKRALDYLPDLNSLKMELKNEILSLMPDYSLIRSDVESIIETFKSELEREKGKIETSLEILKKQIETPLPRRAVEELEKIRNDWLVNVAKVEAVEKFVENFSNELNNLKPIIKKLETFENLMNLQEDVTDKLQTIKEYQEGMEDVLEKNTQIERRIQKEVNNFKIMTKETYDDFIKKITSDAIRHNEELKGEFEKLERNHVKRINEIIRPIEDSVAKNEEVEKRIQKEVKKLKENYNQISKIEETLSELTEDVDKIRKHDEEVMTEISIRFEKDKKELQSLKADVNKEIENIKRNIDELLLKMKSIDYGNEIKTINKTLPEMQKLISFFGRRLENNEKLIKTMGDDLSVFEGNLMALENRTTELGAANIREMLNKINSLEGSIKELDGKIKELEGRVGLETKEFLDEIINRLVFLETRIAALEGSFLGSKSRPIIIE